MSQPNIPDIDPSIDINREDAINLLLSSIAMEELGLSHIINAEAEKIQHVIGTLDGRSYRGNTCIENLLLINNSVSGTLRNVIKTQMLLQFKLEDTLSMVGSTRVQSPSSTSEPESEPTPESEV